MQKIDMSVPVRASSTSLRDLFMIIISKKLNSNFTGVIIVADNWYKVQLRQVVTSMLRSWLELKLIVKWTMLKSRSKIEL